MSKPGLILIALFFWCLAVSGSQGRTGEQEVCIRYIDEKPFFIHLKPNQEYTFDVKNEAFIEPDAYCWHNGNVIRDEFSGLANAIAQGHTVIAAGFRFAVNVKITPFRIEIRSAD